MEHSELPVLSALPYSGLPDILPELVCWAEDDIERNPPTEYMGNASSIQPYGTVIVRFVVVAVSHRAAQVSAVVYRSMREDGPLGEY
jgi:hypothetical protein